MPLYLVRWPSLTATLISARSEAELIDTIDEVGSPGACTWSVYRGPLMIDFKVPIEIEINEKMDGLTRASDVRVRPLETDDCEFLDVVEPDSCDAASEMREAILRQAFPVLGGVLYDDDDGAPDDRLTRIADAVAADIALHSEELQTVGITFGEGAELLPTRRFCFLRKSRGAFIQTAVRTATAFCCGDEPITPDKDGLVHLVHVDVAYRNRRPISAKVAIALRLRSDANGRIITPHRADAFPNSDDPTKPHGPLHQRRNDAVSWSMSSSDIQALSRCLGVLVGKPLDLTHEDS
jgi:hypothetical protein